MSQKQLPMDIEVEALAAAMATTAGTSELREFLSVLKKTAEKIASEEKDPQDFPIGKLTDQMALLAVTLVGTEDSSLACDALEALVKKNPAKAADTFRNVAPFSQSPVERIADRAYGVMAALTPIVPQAVQGAHIGPTIKKLSVYTREDSTAKCLFLIEAARHAPFVFSENQIKDVALLAIRPASGVIGTKAKEACSILAKDNDKALNLMLSMVEEEFLAEPSLYRSHALKLIADLAQPRKKPFKNPLFEAALKCICEPPPQREPDFSLFQQDEAAAIAAVCAMGKNCPEQAQQALAKAKEKTPAAGAFALFGALFDVLQDPSQKDDILSHLTENACAPLEGVSPKYALDALEKLVGRHPGEVEKVIHLTEQEFEGSQKYEPQQIATFHTLIKISDAAQSTLAQDRIVQLAAPLLFSEQQDIAVDVMDSLDRSSLPQEKWQPLIPALVNLAIYTPPNKAPITALNIIGKVAAGDPKGAEKIAESLSMSINDLRTYDQTNGAIQVLKKLNGRLPNPETGLNIALGLMRRNTEREIDEDIADIVRSWHGDAPTPALSQASTKIITGATSYLRKNLG